MVTMTKYVVIIWSIYVAFVTGQGQRQENVANYQSAPTYLPSTVELQFPLESKANKIAPNVVEEEIQKIPCPIFPQRRLENPNIPDEQPWTTANKWNLVAPAPRRSNRDDSTLRRSNIENPASRRSNSRDQDPSVSRKSNEEIPESWRLIADDPSQRPNTEDLNSRRFHAEEPLSRRLNANDPTSRRFNSENYISRSSNVANPISRRSNSEDASRKSNEEIPESLLFISDEPISRRSNTQVSDAQNFYAGVPSSRRNGRYGEQLPASRRYPWQTVDKLGQTPNDDDSQSKVLPLSNDRQMQSYTNVMPTQLRRDNFNGLPPPSLQPLYNTWQVLSTTSPLPNRLDTQTSNNVLNVPSPSADVQVQPLINYPVEITTPNPSKPINRSDCDIKTNLNNINQPLSENRRDEDNSRRIMPGILQRKQVSTPPSVNLRENSQPDVTTMSNELNPQGEKVADTHIRKIERTNTLQGTSNEQNEDRMSIADIEQQLMEPAKGAGIIKITDAHLSVIDSSRVCYACSSITDPTCWNPERKTTVKYCARGRDSCVTKTYKGKDSLVVIRDCSSACDDALPVLGKKYESCSICGNDLCNNLYVDTNGASSICTRNAIGITIFSWLIKNYFPYQAVL